MTMLTGSILLVEDEGIVAHHLRQQLLKIGYKVAGIAATGKRAMELVAETAPDLILMDINISGDIDGIETARQLRETRPVPVIYLTAYSEEATLERARATKPYGYLLKPFSEREMHAAIQMALERRATDLALEASEEKLRHALRLEAIGQLAGGVAHDFNNLLAVITGNLELLQERFGDEASVADMIRDALAAATRGVSLTQQLLAYSRQQPLNPEVVNVAGLVSELSAMMCRTLGEAVEIETRMAEDLWNIRVDRHQLENVILNLAVNARDAMPGGGKLTIEGTNATLDPDYAEQHMEVTPGDYVMLAVTDNGTGMPPDVVARALDPFFTTKAVGEGTGLGLSMAYGFVKQSSGHIKIYSEIGIGTTVKIYLPRVVSDADAAPRREDAAAMPRARDDEVVLVVEDDPMVRSLAVRLLTGLGYGTIEAESGPEALEHLAFGRRVDLLFTDMVLPQGMSGLQLAKEARAQREGLKVLFMSGYAANTIQRNGTVDGAAPILSKPFRRAELAQVLRHVLDRDGAA